MKLLADVGEVYLHRDAVDFRKSINGLVLIVEQELPKAQPLKLSKRCCRIISVKIRSGYVEQPCCSLSAYRATTRTEFSRA